MNKHTPAPWKSQGVHVWAEIDALNTWSIVDRAGAPNGRAEAEANARLIAAAPDLLAACRAADELIAHVLHISDSQLDAMLESSDPTIALLKRFRRAMAKAEA
jgi:hypothetical protein